MADKLIICASPHQALFNKQANIFDIWQTYGKVLPISWAS